MSITRPSHRESQRDFGVSHTTPTRPDPTRPINNYPRSGFIHVVTYVTRELDDGWMTGAARRCGGLS